jgi:hypothetical protein
LKSVQTGQFCRLAPLPANTSQQCMLCDQPSMATATPFTYTGSGLAVNGVPMVAPTPGGPLLLANTSNVPLGPDSDNLAFPTAGPDLPANSPINIKTPAPTAGNVRSDSPTAFAYVGSGDGTSLPEQYIAVDPANPSSIDPIRPGEAAVMKSAQTGMYCRLAPTGTGTERGMLCDQPSLAGATPLTYTGSGLALDGVPLVSTSPGSPLVLANSTSKPLGPTSDDLAFPPAGALQWAADDLQRCPPAAAAASAWTAGGCRSGGQSRAALRLQYAGHCRQAGYCRQAAVALHIMLPQARIAV